MREERDPAFWGWVINHPEVKPHVTLGRELDVSGFLTSSRVLPLASENGGFLFVQLDGVGRVYELHTAYRPEGWGREVLFALKAACERVFAAGGQLITTYEVEGNWRSRPPKTFRFKPCGDFEPCEYGVFKTWALSKADWLASPARRSV